MTGKKFDRQLHFCKVCISHVNRANSRETGRQTDWQIKGRERDSCSSYMRLFHCNKIDLEDNGNRRIIARWCIWTYQRQSEKRWTESCFKIKMSITKQPAKRKKTLISFVIIKSIRYCLHLQSCSAHHLNLHRVPNIAIIFHSAFSPWCR